MGTAQMELYLAARIALWPGIRLRSFTLTTPVGEDLVGVAAITWTGESFVVACPARLDRKEVDNAVKGLRDRVGKWFNSQFKYIEPEPMPVLFREIEPRYTYNHFCQ